MVDVFRQISKPDRRGDLDTGAGLRPDPPNALGLAQPVAGRSAARFRVSGWKGWVLHRLPSFAPDRRKHHARSRPMSWCY